MKKVIIISLMLLVVSMIVAVPITVTFKELPPNTGTMYNIVTPKYAADNDGAAYPNNHYCIQFYISFDDVIDPLGEDKLPTGDDEEVDITVVQSSHTNSYIGFPPVGSHPWAGRTLQAVDATSQSTNFRQGRKTYMRVFNAHTLAEATQYMQFNGLYTIPTAIIAFDVFASPQTNGFTDWINIPSSVIPTPGWATLVAPALAATNVPLDVILDWEPSAVAPLATGFDFYLNGAFVADVTSATDYLGADLALEYETTYTWGVIPYVDDSIAKKGMKASRVKTYAGELVDMPVWSFTTMDEPVVIEGPDAWATEVSPAIGAMDVALDAQLTWTYDGTVVPTGYKLIWNGGEAMDLGNVMTYNPGALAYNTPYTWAVIPYVNNAAKRGMKATRELLTPAGEMPVWSFTTLDEFVAPAVEVGAADVTLTIVFDGPTPPGFVLNNPVQIFVPGFALPGLTAFNFGVTIDQGVAGQFTYTFSTALLAGRVYLDGVDYYAGDFTGGIVTVVINFTGAKEPHTVVITEPTLPVELASFTAVAHADEYVTLKWITESESNLHGYNVYRAETASFEQAMRINPTVVEANNTTQTTTYTYTDTEVETATYYYWLEVSELSNENTFHGPIVVRVEDDPIIDSVTATTFRNFGPSPFTETTSTQLRVKAGETATVTIYNLLGQVVSRNSFDGGIHNFTFNGKDLNNKSVANGIYFVKMSSPSTSKSFKIVKIK